MLVLKITTSLKYLDGYSANWIQEITGLFVNTVITMCVNVIGLSITLETNYLRISHSLYSQKNNEKTACVEPMDIPFKTKKQTIK